MAAMRTKNHKYIRVNGVEEVLYSLENNFYESEDIKDSLPELYNMMRSEVKEWEKGLVNPLLWDEGIWNEVTKDIHKDLMNNKKVSYFTPEQWRKKNQKN